MLSTRKITFQQIKHLETNIYFLMPIVAMLALARASYFLFASLLGVFCQRDVCASVTEIPYWWCKICPNLVRSSDWSSLYYVNIDLHHQYGISLDKAQMSLLAKRPQLAARSGKRQMFSLASFFYGLDLCLSLVMDWQFACPEILTTA